MKQKHQTTFPQLCLFWDKNENWVKCTVVWSLFKLKATKKVQTKAFSICFPHVRRHNNIQNDNTVWHDGTKAHPSHHHKSFIYRKALHVDLCTWYRKFWQLWQGKQTGINIPTNVYLLFFVFEQLDTCLICVFRVWMCSESFLFISLSCFKAKNQPISASTDIQVSSNFLSEMN